MGSAASSSIQQIEQTGESRELNSEDDSPDDRPHRPSSTKRGGSGQRRRAPKVSPDVEAGNEVTTLGATNKIGAVSQQDAQHKLEELESQLASVESHNLELQDTISSLEHQLGLMGSLSAAPAPTANTDDFSATLHAKDQRLEAAERELTAAQGEVTKLRRRFKKRLRTLTTQLSEAKQGQSVHAFELQDKLQRLTEENQRLNELVQKQSPVDPDSVSAQPDSRTQIILELSAKISDQDAKISELQREIKQRDLLGLTATNPANTTNPPMTDSHRAAGEAASTTSVWSSPEAQPTETGDTHHDKLHNNQHHVNKLHSNQPHGSSPNEVDEEDLKELMQRIQKAQRAKKKNKNPKSGNDFRSSSGESRDSGIVTPKDRSRRSDQPQEGSDWGDSESDEGMSSKPSSGVSRSSAHGEAPTSDLDPASIRRISAAKMRKAKNGSKRTGPVLDKPPMYRPNVYDTELDSLIKEIDSSGTRSKTTRSEPGLVLVPL